MQITYIISLFSSNILSLVIQLAIPPILVHNVYDVCNFIHKLFSSHLVLGYIDLYQFHIVLIKF